MKRTFVTFLVFCTCMAIFAQATDLVIDNQTPGWLSSKINYGDQQTVRNLKVTGYINSTDLKFIGTLISSHSLKGRIDLYNAQIINNDMGINAFGIPVITSRLDSVKCLLLPQTLKTAYAVLSENRGGRPSAVLHTDTLYFNWQNNSLVGYDIGGDISHLILGENIDSITDAIGSDGYGKWFHGWQCGRTFEGVSNLQSVKFDKGMHYIGQRAFETLNACNFNDLENLEYLGQNAFTSVNPGLVGFCPDTIIVPKSLHNPFFLFAFAHKDGQRIFIEDNISTVSGYSVQWGTKGPSCTTAKLIFHINNPVPPKIVNYLGQNSDTNLSTSTIFVPKGSKQAYLKSDYWKNATIVELNPVESIDLDTHKFIFDKGQTRQLAVSISPQDADDKTISWTSGNEDVAIVNDKGLVTAVNSGQTYIYATSVATGIKDSCLVMVRKNVTSVEFEEEQVVLNNIGDSKQLGIKILPEDATEQSVTWNSSNENVCTISSRGHVTAIGPGTAVITVTTVDGDHTATCVVKVLQHVTGLSLDKQALTLKVQESEQLKATIMPENADDKSVVWSSSDRAVATVDVDGLVKAVSAGEAWIKAVSQDSAEAKDSCKVTVIKSVTGVEFEEEQVVLSNAGDTKQLGIRILPEDATDQSVTWRSSNENVCTVSSAGLVKAIAAGTAVITVTTVDGDHTATCVVKVLQHVTGLSLDKQALTLKVQESEQLKATIMPENADDKSVVWSSSDETVASVDGDGSVKALKAGEAWVKVASQDNAEAKDSCKVTVLQPVTGISLSIATCRLTNIGESIVLEATVQPADASNKDVKWISSNDAVCMVANGNVVAIGYGTAVVMATTMDGGFMASCTIIVEKESVPVTGIELSQTTATLTKGETLRLTATAYPADATNKTLIWKSSDEVVCVVSQSGLLIAVGEGSAIVTVTPENGVGQAQCNVTVNNPVDAIKSVMIDLEGSPVYDMMGCRVTSLVKGRMYVRNGQKFIAR